MPRVIYTRLLFFAGGFCLTPSLIFIRPEHDQDAGLHMHEVKHAEQMRRIGTLRFWWRYLTDWRFRFAAEVEAYRVSLIYAPQSVERFATAIAAKYLLPITAS